MYRRLSPNGLHITILVAQWLPCSANPPTLRAASLAENKSLTMVSVSPNLLRGRITSNDTKSN